MLRERFFGQWSSVEKGDGTYVQVRENDVLIFDEKKTASWQKVEPVARIDYNEVAGVTVDKRVLGMLASLTYKVAEMHLRVPKNKRMYVIRIPQGGIFINAQKPLGWDLTG